MDIYVVSKHGKSESSFNDQVSGYPDIPNDENVTSSYPEEGEKGHPETPVLEIETRKR